MLLMILLWCPIKRIPMRLMSLTGRKHDDEQATMMKTTTTTTIIIIIITITE